jgi:glycosyltransferase involved in cell wall biosynthesis
VTPVIVNNTCETFTPTHSGAIATWVWEICRAAQRQGVRPVVMTRRAEQAAYRWPELIEIDHPPLPNTRLGLLTGRAGRKLDGWRHVHQRRFAERIVRSIRENGLGDGPFILHNDPELAVLLRQYFPDSPILHHFHNQQDCKPRFSRRLAGMNVIHTAVSQFTARWNERYYQLPDRSVGTIYNGVDCERFSPADDGAAPDKIVINFCGRTCIEKAPDLLLKAAAIMASKSDRFELQLIGANHWGWTEMDSYQRQLQDLAEQLERQGVVVRRLGHVAREQLPAELRRAHIHVVPSRWDEPCGLTTLEGMASGLATVASRTGGSPGQRRAFHARQCRGAWRDSQPTDR